MDFAFKIGDEVVIVGTVVSGTVISRAEYSLAEFSYLVLLKEVEGIVFDSRRHWISEGFLVKNRTHQARKG